ncbi:MAG: GtrA family protein [Steroidobacteraceae bacterium]
MVVARTEQKLVVRVFWYAVAGVITIALNPGLFALFHEVLGWNNVVAYACSLALVNGLQFIWNYHVGFRSSQPIGVSAARQITTFAASNALNYALVIALQALLPQWKLQIIVVVQTFVAGLKFLAYHYWVYPHKREHAAT